MLFETCSLVRPAMKLPDPIAFQVSGISVYWFGILFAVGIVAALALIYLEAKRKALPADAWLDLCLVLIPCGVIGARLWYVLTHLPKYSQSLLSVVEIWDGGLSIYGAIICGLAGLCIYAYRKKIRLLRLLDVIAPGLALAQAVIAWGDFFDQTGYGKLVENPALQWFPFAVLIEKTRTIHYAVFFYTFLVCLTVFCLLWFVFRKRSQRDGEVLGWYLVLNSGAQLALHFLLEGEPVLSGAKAFYLLLLLAGLAVLLVLYKRPAKPQLTAEESECAEKAMEAPEAADTEPDVSAEAADAVDEPAEQDDGGAPVEEPVPSPEPSIQEQNN